MSEYTNLAVSAEISEDTRLAENAETSEDTRPLDNAETSEDTRLPENAETSENAAHSSAAAHWYVVHTYSGYENKVKANIEKIIENRNMQEFIHQVAVPVQDAVEIKNGKKKTVQRKVFPGYVLLNMIMNDDTWYVVRNTRGVTSFVGPGSKPVPLTDEEVISMGIELPKAIIDLEIGDTVKVVSGPFESSVGGVKEINPSKRTVIVKLSIFGRETPLEMDFSEVIRIG